MEATSILLWIWLCTFNRTLVCTFKEFHLFVCILSIVATCWAPAGMMYRIVRSFCGGETQYKYIWLTQTFPLILQVWYA